VTLNLAETSAVKSRPSVPYGANFCESKFHLWSAVIGQLANVYKH